MITRLELDVLKSLKTPIYVLSDGLSELYGVDGVDVILYERDFETQNVKIIIVGTDIKYEGVKKKLKKYDATIHSVDQVVTGRRELVQTYSDKFGRFPDFV